MRQHHGSPANSDERVCTDVKPGNTCDRADNTSVAMRLWAIVHTCSGGCKASQTKSLHHRCAIRVMRLFVSDHCSALCAGTNLLASHGSPRYEPEPRQDEHLSAVMKAEDNH
eukprot:2255361-Amphidinium_carterae.1